MERKSYDSCSYGGGKDLRKFSKEADVKTTAVDGDDVDSAAIKLRTKFGSQVNLTMAMYKLMHTKQSSKPFTQFTKEIEEIAVQRRHYLWNVR